MESTTSITVSDARSRIVTASRRQFLAHGFRSVTMDDLAADLGMSKKTFYSHFSSKTELVQAVLQDKLAGVDRALAAIVSDGDDFSRTLAAMLSCMQKETLELQPAFLRDLRRDAPDLWKLVETGRAEIISRHFTKLIADGRKAGMIRKDISPRIIIEVLIGATQQIANPERLEALQLTPQSALSAILTVVLDGAIVRQSKDRL